MSETIEVKFHDHVFVEIVSDNKKIHDEISDYFSFQIKNAEFMRRSMGFYWDGRIKLYKKRQKLLPFGLLRRLKGWAEVNDYTIEFDDKILACRNNETDGNITKHLKDIAVPFVPRDYQVAAITESIRRKRIVVESPTSSGKSFVIYVVARYVGKRLSPGEKILIVVPTVTLLYQLEDNFKEYGFTGKVHVMKAGAEDNGEPQIYISTFQSLFRRLERRIKPDRRKKQKPFQGGDRRKLLLRRIRLDSRDPNYFKQFRCLMIDEAHGVRAATDGRVLNDICEACTAADWRVALSGTFSDESVDKRVVEGYFGAFHSVITTSELIERGQASKFQIRVIKLRYPRDITNQLNGLDFRVQQEFQEATDNPRQQYVVSLVNSLPKNTIVLFHLLEHGKHLYDQIQRGHKETYYIDGDTPGPDRLETFKRMEEDTNMVLVASYAVCSAGVNIKNLHNVVFAASYKSKIRVLQSIGRSLRLHKDKDMATLYDLVDLYRYPEKHYAQRLEFYHREKFPVEEKEVELMRWVDEQPKT